MAEGLVECPYCGWEGTSEEYLKHYEVCPKRLPLIKEAKPEDKYPAFEDLRDPVLLEEIKRKLAFWDERLSEAVRTVGKVWSAQELLDLVDIFGRFNVALNLGLPNEVYNYFYEKLIMVPTKK